MPHIVDFQGLQDRPSARKPSPRRLRAWSAWHAVGLVWTCFVAAALAHDLVASRNAVQETAVSVKWLAMAFVGWAASRFLADLFDKDVRSSKGD